MRNFIEHMREKGYVVDIEDPFPIEFEAPKFAAKTDKILFFHKFAGARAVMNVTPTRQILGEALGIDWQDIPRHLAGASFDGQVIVDGTLALEKPNLTKLPVMWHYPGDAGRYITAGIVFSQYEGIQNAAIHRMLILDNKRVVARLVEGRHTYLMHEKALERGEVLPIAVAIGTHPIITFASCTRVPVGKELAYAAELFGGEIHVHQCPNGVVVPDAEIILEGYIGKDTTNEGPFVDITGTYDSVRVQPIIEFTGIHTKRDFIYHGILPGGNEHMMLMGVPYEPKIFRAVSEVTGIRNVVLTRGGCGYLHAVLQIKKSSDGDAKNAIMAAFTAHTSLKHVVVVDEDIDPFNPFDIEYAIATRVRGDKDIMVVTGTRGSSLDPSQLADGTNVKVGIDATMTLGEESSFKRALWT